MNMTDFVFYNPSKNYVTLCENKDPSIGAEINMTEKAI
jgi:hypothetical protein